MSGFAHAPVTKGLMILVPVVSLFTSLTDYKPIATVIWHPHITVHHQYSRFFIQPFIYINSSELFLSLIALYATSRAVERAYGSRKFLTFLVLVQLISTVIAFFSLAVLHRPWGFNKIHPGPTALLFAIALRWWQLVPTLYTVRLFGLELADKTPTLLLILHFLFYSYLTPISGLLAAHTVASHPSLCSALLPSRIVSPVSRVTLPLIGSLAPPRRSNDPWPDDVQSNDIGISSSTNRTAGDGRERIRTGMLNEMRRRVSAAAGVGSRVQPVPTNGGGERPRRPNRASVTSVAAPHVATRVPEAAPAVIAGLTAVSEERAAPTRVAGDGEGLTAGWSTVEEGRQLVDARAAVRVQVDLLQSVFPDIPRPRIESVLRESDFEHNRAVESLLLDDGPR